jgi:transposase InsO family protein
LSADVDGMGALIQLCTEASAPDRRPPVLGGLVPVLVWLAVPSRDRQASHSRGRSRRAAATGARRFRCHLDRWPKDVMGIEGIPIPYGAPNANAHVERFHRTLREGALRHFIFLNERHVRRVCAEFVAYYNGARPSQATHAIPARTPS